MEKEWKEIEFTVDCMFPSQLEWKVEQEPFFAAPVTVVDSAVSTVKLLGWIQGWNLVELPRDSLAQGLHI